MTTDRPAVTADPMPEPTPDRAVMEMGDEALIDMLMGSGVLMLAAQSNRDDDARIRYETQMLDLRAELLRRLNAATERPADGVTISRELHQWACDELEAFDGIGYLPEEWDAFQANLAALAQGSDDGELVRRPPPD